MNVEARYAGEIFNTAARLLDTALNAQGGKVDPKLKNDPNYNYKKHD